MRLVSFVRGLCLAAGLISASLTASAAQAEDGYDLWLRYRPLPAAQAPAARTIAPSADTPTLKIARAELRRGLDGLAGGAPVAGGPSILLGTPAGSPAVAALNLPLKGAGQEGYLIRTVGATTVIAANSDIGVLYGVFHYLRLVQTGQGVDKLDILSAPKVNHRLLNHWDNLDTTVERGYAGASLWDWWKLPDHKDPRYVDYARANASIGINGTVLNNVNAKSDSLTAPYIAKAAALAEVFRPYGIKVYLSARFSSILCWAASVASEAALPIWALAVPAASRVSEVARASRVLLIMGPPEVVDEPIVMPSARADCRRQPRGAGRAALQPRPFPTRATSACAHPATR